MRADVRNDPSYRARYTPMCFIRISGIALPLIDTALLHVYVILFVLKESVGWFSE